MLARIKLALSRETSAPVLAPVPCSAPEEFSTNFEIGLSDLFCRGIEAVGGRVAYARSNAQIETYLGPLLESSHSSVALSGSKALRELGVRQLLENRELRVLPGLNEFISAQSKQADDHENGNLIEQYERELLEAQIGITSASYGIAATGTLVLISSVEQHRLISLLPPVHVCLVSQDRIIRNMGELLARVRQSFYLTGDPPRDLTFITGPSCTADIEMTLTKGMHGPRELHVLIYGESDPEFAGAVGGTSQDR